MEDHTSLLDDFNFTYMIQVAAEGYSGGMVLLWRANELLVDPITTSA